MQIGDLHESVTRDASARREAMVGQIRQMVDRLNVAPPSAIPPAAAQADTVRISPEARQAMNSLARASARSSSASPREVIASIRSVLVAATPDAMALAGARLAELVRNIVVTFPPRALGAFHGYPIDDHAAELVRALMPAAGQPAPPPATVAAMVRALFPGRAEGNAPPEATLQRAALAIFLATARMTVENPHHGVSAALAEAQTGPAELPAALLGHLVPPEKKVRREPVLRRKRMDHHDREEEDSDDGEESGSEVDPGGGHEQLGGA